MREKLNKWNGYGQDYQQIQKPENTRNEPPFQKIGSGLINQMD